MCEDDRRVEGDRILRILIGSCGVTLQRERIAADGRRRRTQKQRHPRRDECGILRRPAREIQPQTLVEVLLLDLWEDQGAPGPAGKTIPSEIGICDAVSCTRVA